MDGVVHVERKKGKKSPPLGLTLSPGGALCCADEELPTLRRSLPSVIIRRNKKRRLGRRFFEHFARNAGYLWNFHGNFFKGLWDMVSVLSVSFVVPLLGLLQLFSMAVMIATVVSPTFVGTLFRSSNVNQSLGLSLASVACGYIFRSIAKKRSVLASSMVNRSTSIFEILSFLCFMFSAVSFIVILGSTSNWSNNIRGNVVPFLVFLAVILYLLPNMVFMGVSKYSGITVGVFTMGLVCEYHIFRTSVFEIPYSDEAWTWLSLGSLCYLLVSTLFLGHWRDLAMHNMFRWRVQRAFFKNKGGPSFCGSCQSNKGNTLEDVPPDAPQYIAACTVNNWQIFGHDPRFDKSHDVFTFETGPEPVAQRLGNQIISFGMTPEEEREDEAASPDCPSSASRKRSSKHPTLVPIALSEAMSISGAAVASNMGRLGMETSSLALGISGLSLGRWQRSVPKPSHVWVIWRFLWNTAFYGLIMLVTFDVIPSVISYVSMVWGLASLLCWGGLGGWNSNRARRILECCHSLVPDTMDGFRESLGLNEANRNVPDRLFLSDGGHIENLGLFPLLVKKEEAIIVVDSGTDAQMELNSLLYVIDHARATLGCSFFALRHENPCSMSALIQGNHRNVTECLNPPPIRFPDDIDHTGRFANLVGTNHRLMEETEDFEVALKRVMMPSCTSNIFNLEEQRALAPRAFHFYVHYADGKIGKISILKPRPVEQRSFEAPSIPEESASPFSQTISSEDLRNLDGCCCNCCHRKISCCGFCAVNPFSCFRGLLGTFPNHSTVLQCLSPMQATSYIENGYAAMQQCLDHPRWGGHFELAPMGRINTLESEPLIPGAKRPPTVLHSVCVDTLAAAPQPPSVPIEGEDDAPHAMDRV